MLYRQVLIFTALACIASVQSFQLPVKALNGSRNDLTRISRKSVTLHERKSKTEPVDDADPEKTVIPLLPAVGASSHPKASTQDLGNPAVVQIPKDETDERSQSTAVVSSKFSLQYTCNVCDTRNSHLVSRMAYREGLVITICKGCGSKHLIADNLDGKTGFDGNNNIEDYFKERGMDLVNRVTQEVFDLESILFFDSAGGALAGDDGSPVLE